MKRAWANPEGQGAKLGHLGETCATATPRWKEPVEGVRAFGRDVYLTPSGGGVPACPSGKRPRGRSRDYISQLVWKHLGIPQDELEEVAREKDVWVSLLSLLPLRPSPR